MMLAALLILIIVAGTAMYLYRLNERQAAKAKAEREAGR